MNKHKWLPHLKNSIPKEAYGYPVSMYSIALEGWRRGLTLKFINNYKIKTTTKYSLSYQGKEHSFIASQGDLVTGKINRICRDKHRTKKILLKNNVPVPEGELFHKENSDEEIIEYANSLGYPLVLKPSNALGGRGVIANIESQEEFKKALSYVKYELNYSDLIVERFFEGEDFRIYVVGDEVIAAMKRIPANVIGDGKNSIKELLKLKTEERRKNPALRASPTRKDKEMNHMLNSQGYTINSVPKDGERVFLKTTSNISSGGEPVDITDQLTDEIKKIAVNAAKSIPGLVQCGVDVIVNDKENSGVVLEINSRPSIRAHLFPMEGKARDIPKAIIDYYFPETKANHKSPLYFDINHVFEAFQNSYAREIVVPDHPQGEIELTRFIVSGKVSNINYERWIRRQARLLRVNGYVKLLENGKMSIVVAGSTDSVANFRQLINNESPRRAKINKVIEKSRKSPVKMGFEIFKNNDQARIHNTNFNKVSTLEKERDIYRKKYEQMKSSRSWRITKPIRKFLGVISR